MAGTWGVLTEEMGGDEREERAGLEEGVGGRGGGGEMLRRAGSLVTDSLVRGGFLVCPFALF